MNRLTSRQMPTPGSGVLLGPFFFLLDNKANVRRYARPSAMRGTRVPSTNPVRAEIERAIDSVAGVGLRRRHEWAKRQARQTPRAKMEAMPIGIHRIGASRSPEQCPEAWE